MNTENTKSLKEIAEAIQNSKVNEDELFKTDTYYFTDKLKNAVLAALTLEMPLLVTGEPGTGKTKLAEGVKQVLENFYGKNNVKLYKFFTKSVTVFNDLLYTYDHLRHYMLVEVEKEKLNKDLATYEGKGIIQINALGKAFKNSNPSVVLIDEVDKAPRDFPNDLLDILEEKKFTITELENTQIANQGYAPFVVITSNQEKTLPDPFLRRCIYFHIEFPDNDTLKEIIKKHLSAEISQDEFNSAINWFNKARETLDYKKPATAELIAWIKFLLFHKFDLEKLSFGKTGDLSQQQKTILLTSFSIIAKNNEDYKKLLEKNNLL